MNSPRVATPLDAEIAGIDGAMDAVLGRWGEAALEERAPGLSTARTASRTGAFCCRPRRRL